MPYPQLGNIRFHFDNVHFEHPLNFPPFRVMQVGDLASVENYECPEHVQVVHEITYVVSGKAVFLADGVPAAVKSGDVIFNPNGSRHEIKSLGLNSVRYYYLGFEISDLSAPEERALADFFNTSPPAVAPGDPSIPNAFQDIFINILNPDDFSLRYTADAIRRLLILTLRSLRGGGKRVYLPDLSPEKNATLSQICSFIDRSVENINILKQLPEQFGYSYSYLSSVFSKAMGMNLREYFLMRRHEHECELLTQGLNVTAVAEKMGYSSVHSFSHAFTARCGISPGFYTEKTKRGNDL